MFGLQPSATQRRAQVGIELAQFPLAGVAHLHAKALGCDLDLDLAVINQAELTPVRMRAAKVCAWNAVLAQPLKEGVVEGQNEHCRLSVELKLRGQNLAALRDIGG